MLLSAEFRTDTNDVVIIVDEQGIDYLLEVLAALREGGVRTKENINFLDGLSEKRHALSEDFGVASELGIVYRPSAPGKA